MLSLSMVLYVWFALSLLKEDKSATISEMASLSAERINENVKNFLGNYKKGVFVLNSLTKSKNQNSKNVETIFESYSEFIQFSRLSVKDGVVKNKVDILDQNYLDQFDLSKEIFDLKNKKWPLSEIAQNREFYQLITLGASNPIMEMFFLVKDEILFARVRVDSLNQYLESYKLQDNLILFHQDLIGNRNDYSQSFQSELKILLKETDLKKGTTEVQIGDQSYLMGINKENNHGVVISSLIELNLAYKAVYYLQQKSAYFALLLLSMAVILGVLISRRMTMGLQNLFDTSQKFASGDLEAQSEVKGSDEIGALSDSFNHMTEEIRRYMGEMEEKLRMEKELEIARLVQDSFFPQDVIEKEDHQVHGFYHPASECGGDWWGYLDKDDWSLLIIADATGHGVPAALITATANCCLENLKTLIKENPQMKITPSYVLKFMNKAVKGVGSDILMTAFVTMWMKKENKLLYSNASHQPALLYPLDKGEVDKKKIKSLLSTPGARLGHEENPDYEEGQIDLENNQRLFLYTDGIIETENQEKKPYGQRRLLKLLGKKASSDLLHVANVLKDEVVDFHGSDRFEDDLTFVMMDFKKKEKSNKIHVINELAQKNLSHFVAPHQNKELEEFNRNLKNKENVSFEDVLGTSDWQEEAQLKESEKINSVVDDLVEKINDDGFFDSPKDYLKLISKELLSNAFFHHSEKTSSQTREEKIELSDCSIGFKLGKGTNGIAISVKDPFGKLHKDQLIQSLKRAYSEQSPEEKEGGAGLGLFMAFENSDVFIVNTVRDKQTEIICLIYPQKRYKKFREQTTSFHFYEGDS